MIGIALVCAISLILAVLAPFFIGGETKLQSASLSSSAARLEAEKKALVQRFIEDEAAFEAKKMNKIVWEQRRQFLVNRYIDASRRLDYLKHEAEVAATDGP